MVKAAAKPVALAAAKKDLTAKGTPRKREPRPGEGGQRQHTPTDATRAKVIDLRVEGATLAEIGEAIGCSPFRVTSYYAEELKASEVLRNDRVESVLYKAAISGKSIVGAIYWSKARMSWFEASAANLPAPATAQPNIHITLTRPPQRDKLGNVIPGTGFENIPIDDLPKHLDGLPH